MSKKSVTDILILGFYFIIFTLFQRSHMFYMLGKSSILESYSSVILLALSLFYLIKKKFYRSKDNSFSVFYIFYTVVLFISLFYSLFYPFTYILLYSILFVPIVSALFIRTYVYEYAGENLLLFSFTSFVFLFIYYLSNSYMEILADEDTATNASYTILYMLPLLLCSKRIIIKLSTICLTVVAVLLSLKRGSILSLSIGLLFYFYIFLFKQNHPKSKFFRIIILIIISIIFYKILMYFNNLSNDVILNRFLSISDDMGSGRVEIFKHTREMIHNSSFLEKIFGHGWNRVIADSNLGFSAHNDHLEIIYDFGIVGYVLYILMFLNLIRFNITLIKSASDLAAPMTMSLIIFFAGSLYSHIVIYPYYMTIFVITWSYIITTFNKNHLVKFSIKP